MTFREKLRLSRKQLNLTQFQIASTLGIDRSAYSYYETGKSQPPMDKILTLSKIFNCSIDELMCTETPKTSFSDSNSIYDGYQTSPIASLPKDEQDLLIMYRAMPESMCENVLKYMKNSLKLSEE